MAQKANILIVDDVPENLSVLSSLLKMKGYKVRTLPNGRLALKSIENNMPDLILLDISMPGMDGYEVCRILKSNEKYKNIPVIFISALSDTFDKVKAFEVGGVDYIGKPFEAEEVNARVKTHLTIVSLQRELEKHNKDLQQLVEEKVKEISEAQMATIVAMTKLAEARDDDTGKHVERLGIFSRLIAENLKRKNIFAESIDCRFIENLGYASTLHDIGKIAISDNVLLKPGKLAVAEFEVMKAHAAIGAENLREVKKMYPNNEILNMGISIANYHHEKWDGSGYPEGLSGEHIPLCARIVALADVYDALRSKRVYKEAFSHEESKNIIIEGAAKHFDPRIVEAFIELEEDFEKIRDHMND